MIRFGVDGNTPLRLAVKSSIARQNFKLNYGISLALPGFVDDLEGLKSSERRGSPAPAGAWTPYLTPLDRAIICYSGRHGVDSSP
jgi:hypothetical protein